MNQLRLTSQNLPALWCVHFISCGHFCLSSSSLWRPGWGPTGEDNNKAVSWGNPSSYGADSGFMANALLFSVSSGSISWRKNIKLTQNNKRRRLKPDMPQGDERTLRWAKGHQGQEKKPELAKKHNALQDQTIGCKTTQKVWEPFKERLTVSHVSNTVCEHGNCKGRTTWTCMKLNKNKCLMWEIKIQPKMHFITVKYETSIIKRII